MSKKPVHATKAELLYSYHRLTRLYTESKVQNAGMWLLLLYAVECGLKYAIMSANKRLKSTEDFEPNGYALDHDINRMLGELGWSCQRLQQLRYGKNWNYRIAECSQVHQVMRYGVEYREEDMKGTVERLVRIDERLRSELP